MEEHKSGARAFWAFLLTAVLSVAGYFFSLWLLSLYTEGDQAHYARFYNELLFSDPAQWSKLQRIYIGSSEPLYQHVMGFAAWFYWDRITYISVWNAIFIGAASYALFIKRASLPFWFLTFTNYYVLVLLSSAERLKFAYLFLVLAYCVKSVRWQYVLGIVSVFFHAQAAIQFASAVAYYLASNVHELRQNGLRSAVGVVAAVALAGVAAYLFANSLGEILIDKYMHYNERSAGLSEAFQWGLVLVCGLVAFERRFEFAAAMLPIGVATIALGNRANVATLALFAMLALSRHKTWHPLVLAVMAYMSFKSIGFILNVLETGQAF